MTSIFKRTETKLTGRYRRLLVSLNFRKKQSSIPQNRVKKPPVWRYSIVDRLCRSHVKNPSTSYRPVDVPRVLTKWKMLIRNWNVLLLLLLSGGSREFRGIAQIRFLRTFFLRYYFPRNCLGFDRREKTTYKTFQKNNDVEKLGRRNSLSLVTSAVRRF